MLHLNKKLTDGNALEFFIEDMLADVKWLLSGAGIIATPEIVYLSGSMNICIPISDLYESPRFVYFKNVIKNSDDFYISILPLFNTNAVTNYQCPKGLKPVLSVFNLIIKSLRGPLLRCVCDNYAMATFPC
jgi:hypothetical protein